MFKENDKNKGIYHNDKTHQYDAFKDGKCIGSIDDDRTRGDISQWEATMDDIIYSWNPYL